MRYTCPIWKLPQINLLLLSLHIVFIYILTDQELWLLLSESYWVNLFPNE